MSSFDGACAAVAHPDEDLPRWQAPSLAASRPPPSPPTTVEALGEIEQAAYADGYQRGYDAGLERGSADAAVRVGRLKEIFQELVQPLADLDVEVERTLVQIASAVAQRIIRQELTTSPETIGNMIHEAVEAIANPPHTVTVFLNPDDAVFVREHLDQPVEGPHWKIMADDALSPGDCRVETDDARADAKLADRVARLVGPAFQ